MALFRRNQNDDGRSEQEQLDALRLREQMVSRREADAMRREKTILERQIDLDRRVKELTKREAELKRMEERVLKLKRDGSEVGGGSDIVAAPFIPGRDGPASPAGSPSISATPPTGGMGSAAGAQLSPAALLLLKRAQGNNAAGGPAALGGPGPLGVESDPRLEEIKKREAKIKAEQQRLEEWAADLDRQSADLAVREARFAMAAAAPPAPSYPGAEASGSQIISGGSGIVTMPGGSKLTGVDAARLAELERQLADIQQREQRVQQQTTELIHKRIELERRESDLADRAANPRVPNELIRREADVDARAASLEGRAAELDRQSAELREREHKLIGQITAQAVRAAELERQSGDLSKLQADLYQTQEMLDARQFELDKREVELLALKAEVEELQQKVDKKKSDLEKSGVRGKPGELVQVAVDLPDYVSEMSVLKADQLKLQERMLSGGSSINAGISSTHADDMATNVLF